MLPQFIVTDPPAWLHGAFKAYGLYIRLMSHGTRLGNLRSILQNSFDNEVVWLADKPSESLTDLVKGMGAVRFIRDNGRPLGFICAASLRKMRQALINGVEQARRGR